MRSTHTSLIALVLLLSALGPSAPFATTLRGSCTLSKTKWATTPDVNSITQSTSFVAVPGSKITFTQSAAGCVIVQFSAGASTDTNTAVVVQAQLDGATLASPDDNVFSRDSDEADRAMSFVFPKVSAGSHVVEMQYKSDTGLNVLLGDRTVIVQYQ
jgi:hypothetical protein